MTLLKILGILVLALIIVVPLLEKFGKHHEPEEVGSLTKWILPICALLIIVQLIMHWSGQ